MELKVSTVLFLEQLAAFELDITAKEEPIYLSVTQLSRSYSSHQKYPRF